MRLFATQPRSFAKQTAGLSRIHTMDAIHEVAEALRLSAVGFMPNAFFTARSSW